MPLTFEETTTRIEALRQLKDEITQAELDLRLIKAQYQAGRTDLLEVLKEAKVTSFKGERTRIAISKRHDVQITNQADVIGWLRENKFEVDSYIKLDSLMTKPLLKNAVYEQGEVVPGVERVETEILTISPLKETE